MTLTDTSITSANQIAIPGFTKLNSAGSESNYLDWSLCVQSVFETETLLHTITHTDLKDRPASYAKDCRKVKTFFLCYVENSNFSVIRKCGDDTVAMWEGFRDLHLDSSAASKMYWLKNIVTATVEGDNIEQYLDRLQVMHDHLNTLVTSSSPLKTDDILAAAISLAVPLDWQHVLTPLLQRSEVSSATIISALRSEGLRRRTQGLTVDESIVVSKAHVEKSTEASDNPSSSVKYKGWSRGRRETSKLVCDYCDMNGHIKSKCRTKLSDDLEASRKEVLRLKSKSKTKKEKANPASTPYSPDGEDTSSTIDFTTSELSSTA